MNEDDEKGTTKLIEFMEKVDQMHEIIDTLILTENVDQKTYISTMLKIFDEMTKSEGVGVMLVTLLEKNVHLERLLLEMHGNDYEACQDEESE